MAEADTRVKAGAEAMRAEAIGIMDYLNRLDLWDNVQIYAGGYRYASEKTMPGQLPGVAPDGAIYYCSREDASISIKNIGPDAMAITFEGPLYDRINYAPDGQDFLYGMSERFMHKHNMYFDMVNAFTIAACRS